MRFVAHCLAFDTPKAAFGRPRRWLQINEVYPTVRKNPLQIKDEANYDELYENDASREKDERISNAYTCDSLGQLALYLQVRSNAEMYDEAKRIGIECRPTINKKQLISALRRS